jgi:hypothetical protein
MSKTTTDAEAIHQAITRRLAETADDIEEALAHVGSADVAFAELSGGGWLADADLAESGAGDDARERLAQAAAALRDVGRIIENRQLRDHIVALEDRK